MLHASHLIASAAVLLALNTPAWSQTVSSTENPVQWLTQNLGGAACVVYTAGPSRQRMQHVTENTEVRFDGCRMVLQQATGIDSYSDIRTFNVPLATLDAHSVSRSDGFELPDGWTSTGDVPTHTIHLTVPAGHPLIESRTETFDGLPPRTVQTEAVDIHVRHRENAVQIVRALTLAIEACASE